VKMPSVRHEVLAELDAAVMDDEHHEGGK